MLAGGTFFFTRSTSSFLPIDKLKPRRVVSPSAQKSRRLSTTQHPQPSPMSSTATVKWFDAKKGYGFASPETGGEDIFIHSANIAKDADGKTLFLDDGDTIYCMPCTAPRGPPRALPRRAEHVCPIVDPCVRCRPGRRAQGAQDGLRDHRADWLGEEAATAQAWAQRG